MSTRLSQQLAAAIAGVTDRRLRQLDHEADPPPRYTDGGYPTAAFGAWLARRELARKPAVLRPFLAGREHGAGAMVHRVLDDLRIMAGTADLGDLWPEHRQPAVAELRDRLDALPNAVEVRALLLAYVDQIEVGDWSED